MSIEMLSASLGYKDKLVVETLNFSLEKGKMTALIGPNGCGKSTILRAMSGLISPSSGQVLLNGSSIAKQPRKLLAKRLAFLPQAPQIPDNMTVLQLVEQGRFAHRGLFSALNGEDVESVDWALEQAGMSAYRQRYLTELSGGERQRAWIAAALAQKTDILLLDEPTTYLDLGHQLEVLELLQSLSREQSLTVALSLHEINHALMFADSIAVVKAGQLLFNGDAKSLSKTSLLESTFAIQGYYTHGTLERPIFLATGSGRHAVEIGNIA